MTVPHTISRLWPIFSAIGEGVVLPVGVFLVLSAAGTRDVIALTGSAAASVLLLVIGWLRTRTFNTLGVLVLLQFVLSLVMLGITDDARLILVKDAVITCLTGIAIVASLALRESFIVRIQRDLAQNKEAFEKELSTSASMQRVYHRATLLWGAGLTLEPALEISIIYSTKLTTAIILNNTIGTTLILSLIIITQLSVRRAQRTAPTWEPGIIPGASDERLK